MAPGASYLRKYRVRLDKIRRLLIRFCVNNGRILDVGCGDGLTTNFLMDKLPMRVYGFEVDEKCAHEANKHFTCKVCDCGTDTFPFDDKFFDIIHAGEVVEHVLDTDHLIAECKRTLKNDGVFIISTPNLACWANRILLMLGKQPFDSEVSHYECYGLIKTHKMSWEPVGHLRCFTQNALKELLVAHDFEILEIQGASSEVPFGIVRLIDKICDKWLPSFARKIIVACGKDATTF